MTNIHVLRRWKWSKTEIALTVLRKTLQNCCLQNLFQTICCDIKVLSFKMMNMYTDPNRERKDKIVSKVLNAIKWMNWYYKILSWFPCLLSISIVHACAVFNLFHLHPQELIDYFSSHPNVLPGGIGVIGISKGGELALHMSTVSEKVRF